MASSSNGSDIASSGVLVALADSCRRFEKVKRAEEKRDETTVNEPRQGKSSNIEKKEHTFRSPNTERTVDYLISPDKAREFLINLGFLYQYDFFAKDENIKPDDRQILGADGFIIADVVDGRLGLKSKMVSIKTSKTLDKDIITYYREKKNLLEEVDNHLKNAKQEERPRISMLDLYFLGKWFTGDDDDKRLCSELKDKRICVDDQLGMERMVLTGVRVERFKKPLPGTLKICIDGSTKKKERYSFGYAIWDADGFVDFGGGDIERECCRDDNTNDVEISAGCLSIEKICEMIEEGKLESSKHFKRGTTTFVIEFDRRDAVKAFEEGTLPENPALEIKLEKTISMMKEVMGDEYSFVWISRAGHRLPDYIAKEYSKGPRITKEDLKEHPEFKTFLKEEENEEWKIVLPKKRKKKWSRD